MEIDNIKKVLVLGAGTVGRQVGLQCSIHGYKVTLYDISLDAIESAKHQITTYADQLVTIGLLTSKEATSTLARITTTNDPEKAATSADLLSESVPEIPELKCRVFTQFNKLCPSHTIFTTNTSTLLPSMFAAATGRPAQFAALHFHPNPWETNLVEIMPHRETSKKVLALLRVFAEKIGQIPVVLAKESQSYLFNAMLNAMNSTAIGLASDGVASVEDIDRAWMVVSRMPVGPFGILDSIGLDVVFDVTQYWSKALGNPRLRKNASFLKQYVDRRHLGIKSGKGFYRYPNPDYEKPEFLLRKKAEKRSNGKRSGSDCGL